MAERFKAPVLKTDVGKPTGGSNPSPSAFFHGATLAQQVASKRQVTVATAPIKTLCHFGLSMSAIFVFGLSFFGLHFTKLLDELLDRLHPILGVGLDALHNQ